LKVPNLIDIGNEYTWDDYMHQCCTLVAKVVVDCLMFATYNFHAICLQSQNMIDHNHIYDVHYIPIGVNFTVSMYLQ
jgi:hypothetical protein